jgi:hypothetical protein
MGWWSETGGLCVIRHAARVGGVNGAAAVHEMRGGEGRCVFCVGARDAGCSSEGLVAVFERVVLCVRVARLLSGLAGGRCGVTFCGVTGERNGVHAYL